MMDYTNHSSETSSPTSYSSGERERDRDPNTSSSGTVGTSNGSFKLSGGGVSMAWGNLPSRKPPGLSGLVNGAIGSERMTGALSPSINAPSIASAAGDWFPPLSKASEAVNNQPVRSVSNSGIASIGSGRRIAGEPYSARSSRPVSPSVPLSSHQSPMESSSTTFLPSSLSGNNAAVQTMPVNSEPFVTSQLETSSAAGSNTTSTPSELESAFDTMLRGSTLFHNLKRRIDNLEVQLQSMMANPPHPTNGHFDVTPTRSPSVATSGAMSAYLNAPVFASRSQSFPVQGQVVSPFVAPPNLHSPSISAPDSALSYGGLPNLQTTSNDRDVIQQLTAQLSVLGSNVAQLMAQQAPPTPAPVSASGLTATSIPGGGSWPFDGHQVSAQGQHGHGPLYPALNRPSLANLRSSSFDVPRGGGLPRLPSTAAATYSDDRDTRKRSQMTLQAPSPIGMGSRRHSADVVENMHTAAEGMPVGGQNGPSALGSQSLLGKWEALGVSGELLRAIVKYGIGPPSKIQMKAIPCVLSAQDVVAQASSIQERIQCYVSFAAYFATFSD